MGTSMGCLQDPVVARLGDQMMGCSGDVCGTSVKYVFTIQLRNILNLHSLNSIKRLIKLYFELWQRNIQ